MKQQKKKKKNEKIQNPNKTQKEKSRKKKEKNMGWWKKTENFFRGKSTAVIPKEIKDPTTLNVVLFKQSTLNEIADVCLPPAKSSEFQVHYRGLQLIITHPDIENRLVFTIPTVFFNFPQRVTASSVYYNLDEIAEISNQYADLSTQKANEILNAFPTAFFKARGYDIEARELEMGSIHRHPGDFGFSSVDTDNNVENPGVIFRNKNTMRTSAQEKIQVDSVIYIPAGEVKVVTTETRIVKVKPTEDGTGIEGTYAEAPTINYILEDERRASDFAHFFNVDPEETTDATQRTFKIKKKWFTKDYPQIEGVFNVFLDELDYEPVLKLDPKHITQNSYSYTRGTYDGYGLDDDGYQYYPPATSKTYNSASTQSASFKTRPTWRKSQTLTLLKSRGIDLQKYKEITGDGSEKDMIGIVNALKTELQYDDNAIRAFLRITGYAPELTLNTYYNWLSDQIEAENVSTGDTKTDTEVEADISNIIELLKNSKPGTDLYDSIDILYDSDIPEEHITQYLQAAGWDADLVLANYKASQTIKKP